MGLTSQHQQATLANPTTNKRTIASADVRDNDNAIATKLNAHDADRTIHTESGLLSARPAAGTTGARYLATDTGDFYYDTGSAWALIEDYLIVQAAGVDVGLQPKLNLIAGTNVTINAVDNPGSDRVDVTISSSGGGGGGGGTPSAHATSHQDGGTDEISVTGLSGLLADVQKVAIQKSGAAVGSRKTVNLIPGTNVTMTVADNAGSDRVDVTVNSTASGGTPSAHASSHQNGGSDQISVAGLAGQLSGRQLHQVSKAGTAIGTRDTLNFIEGTNVTLTVADDAGNGRVNVTVAAAGAAHTGTGTSGKLVRWSGSAAQADSQISDAGTGNVIVNNVLELQTAGSYFLALAGTTAVPSIRIPHGVAPTTPTNGDFWTTTAGYFGRINAATVQFAMVPTALTAGRIPKASAAATLADSSIEDSGTTVNINAALTVDRASYSAGAGDYPVGGVIISTLSPSGTAPTGTLWCKY